MELTKELKEKVESAQTREETKKILKEAGHEVADEELNQAAGGISMPESGPVTESSVPL